MPRLKKILLTTFVFILTVLNLSYASNTSSISLSKPSVLEIVSNSSKLPQTSGNNSYVITLKNISKKEEFERKYNINRNLSFVDKSSKFIHLNINSSQLSTYKNDPNVDSIEPDNFKKISTITPNDYYFNHIGDFQSSLHDQWNLENINLPSAWSLTTGSTNIVVAVIDTGIDLTHPDLQNNIWTNSGEISGNGIDDDHNGFIDDVHGWNFVDNNNNVQDNLGHGTHVSGIIAASSNNSFGISGTCWTCKIMPVKVVNDLGYAYDSNIANGIEYAIANHANVINISLGGAGFSQVLQNAITDAWNANVLVVTAAGNDSGNASDSYPGGMLDALSVGASDYTDTVTSYSNKGNKLDIVAPGETVLSTRIQSLHSSAGCLGVNFDYYCLSGTSMASPHVAGVAALLYELHSGDINWNVAQIRGALLKNTMDLLSPGFDTTSGFGKVNSSASLSASLMSTDTTAPSASLSMPLSNYSNGNTYIKGQYNIIGSVSDSNLYSYIITIKNHSGNYVAKQLSGRTNISNNTLATLDTTTLNDGAYDISLVAEDFAGNHTLASSVIQIYIDNNPPSSFGINAPGNNQWINNRNPQIIWNTPYSSSPITYDVNLDGSVISSNQSTVGLIVSSALNEGDHTIFITAKDVLNNTTTTSVTTFHIDVSPPNDFSVNAAISGSSVSLTYNASDNISGIWFYQLSLDNSTPFTVGNSYIANGLSDGNHIIIIYAYDQAGNVKQSSTSFNVNTRTPFLKGKADFNQDGKVDLSDLSILAQNWNKNTSIGDANGDGKVDLSDLSILAQNWNKNF